MSFIVLKACEVKLSYGKHNSSVEKILLKEVPKPTHPKTNYSHHSWFWLLEMVVLTNFLIEYVVKLTIIYSKQPENKMLKHI